MVNGASTGRTLGLMSRIAPIMLRDVLTIRTFINPISLFLYTWHEKVYPVNMQKWGLKEGGRNTKKQNDQLDLEL